MNQQTIYIGIDWADQQHAFHSLSADQSEHGFFDQEPNVIRQQVADWRERFPNCRLTVAIEQSRGPLINALLEHDLVVYPINPAALASYRKAFAHGGGKNDPGDALLLAKFLQHYQAELRPLRHDEPLTRELTALAEDRRRLVDQRTALCNCLLYTSDAADE